MRHGLVVADKPPIWTSHDVVARLRRVYGQRRVGHAGTLDPDATGVLIVGLGTATRLLRFLQDAPKTYRGTIEFGVATDTLDASGHVLERKAMPLEREEVEAAMPRFVGEVEQLPPMVSAVKVGGRKLYEVARAGGDVDRRPRWVCIHRFELEEYEPGPFPRARVVVACSSGTYVRALAADLGAALGGCAHLASLRRLSVGSFTVEEARSLDEVEADPESAILPPLEAVRDLSRLDVDAEQARAVSHGAVFPARTLLGDGGAAGPFAVVGPGGRLLAVYERGRASLKPAVVVAASVKDT